MITNEEIWHARDRLAADHGLTAGGMARAAELDQTIFNRSKRRVKGTGRQRWPSTATVAKVLNLLGVSMAQFGRMVDEASGDGVDKSAARPPNHSRR